jgi:hypothetical protein
MATNVTNWIRSILYGYREIWSNGVPVIARDVINIIGLTVLDDPIKKVTNVTFAGALLPTEAPIANTVMSRNGTGGTSVTALSVYDTVPPLGVQTAHINGATGKMYADNGFNFATETITRAQPYNAIYADTLYTFDGQGRLVTTTNGATYLTFDLDIPDGATLTSVEVWIRPSSPHAGLPATMPVVVFNQIYIESAATTLLAGELDQSASVVDYEAAHAILLNAGSTGPLAPTIIDNTAYFYRVKFTSEASTNALSGCIILGVKATYTTTTYRK